MLNRAAPPVILQFGTSRFLQAHADLFVSQAAEHGRALGGICVVQTTDNPRSSSRTQALARPEGYPVIVRGLRDGQPVDETLTCHAVVEALQAARDWPRVQALMRGPIRVLLSNTGDSGWQPAAGDGPAALADGAAAPGGFVAKLLVLLHQRWQAQPEAPLTLLPCELVSRNGEHLRALVLALAADWGCSADFRHWLQQRPVWANSLVDRIVSEALEPVGAVAEPYALWAVEACTGLQLPCEHPAIVVTDDLGRFERLKLHLLNLGHTLLAELWLQRGSPEGMTVREAMLDSAMRGTLEAVWQDEVLPVFEAGGEGDDARRYLVALRDRLLNPSLVHRLADIAQHHGQKKLRRLQPVVDRAAQQGLGLAQPRLRAALASA